MAQTERHYATGKRKTAVARVYIRPGTGNILVNGRPYDQYFPRQASQLLILQPFELVEAMSRYDVEANVAGGGLAAQADSVRFGIARALTVADGERRRR
jgi:small subunit ribosomal protein S9